ncbi:MAG: nitrous oxide reductase accessory protein NosL [Sulfurospirillaceae bacterium]|nr:nitrous oxide reductase accessory protein NosL [Sulfurospirillaceae bacterium]
MKKFLLTIVLGSLLLAGVIEADKNATCLIRKIKVYEAPRWVTTIQVRSGETIYFCSPKSMFEFFFHPAKWSQYNVKQDGDMRISVNTHDTLKKIDARKAYFVYGAKEISPAGDDLPAFETKESAQKFADKNGGKKVLFFDEVPFALINLLNGRIK